MRHYTEHLIHKYSTIREALVKINDLDLDNILFVVDEEKRLVGALTDGDIRRGLINGVRIDSNIEYVFQKNPKYINKNDYYLQKLIEFRKGNYKIIPVLDDNHRVINVINFRYLNSFLPIDVVIMAGGRGQRLKPLTDHIPKPLLKVGEKPIIEHNLDRLALYGIENFWISINYLGEKIKNYIRSGNEKKINIEYINESEPLGTIGAVSKISNFKNNYVLITNSDLLTNVNYEDFFIDFINESADLAILTIPYHVTVPYAVLDTVNRRVTNFKEKPTFTFFSNGGIYLIKRNLLDLIPKDKFFNATDLLTILIDRNFKVISFPFTGYWLDVGKHEDFEKAQMDIKNFIF